jgi:2,7-dihydroxy-5-methyl-1-naphthoate 7-O-methyltransferase
MDIWELADLSTPWCVHVVATLRIAGRLEAGPMEIGALAAASGAHEESLHCVLRHLVSKGLFDETAPGVFALNEAARGLLDEGLLLGFDLDGLGGRMAHSWSTLLPAVRTGKPAYREVFGRPFWEDLDAHPAIAAEFDALMGPTGHGTPDPHVSAAAFQTVVDVGGGSGAQLAEILRRRPEVRGTLVDLPRTVARSGAIFAAAGVADRVTVVGQSFFDPLPAGADLYVLKNVLADWPDREAGAILARCAEAARPSRGRVAVVGAASPGEPAGPELLMLVLVGGKARTFDELNALARAAGLEFLEMSRQPSGRNVAEYQPIAGTT